MGGLPCTTVPHYIAVSQMFFDAFCFLFCVLIGCELLSTGLLCALSPVQKVFSLRNLYKSPIACRSLLSFCNSGVLFL